MPAEERASAVSQRRVDGMPVVETGLRVPGGQVVHRAWCVVAGADEWAVVEVENRSREPVGVAFVIDGGRGLRYEDRAVLVDGRVALVAPRDPSRFVAEPADGGTDRWAPGARALVFPLAHTASLRAAVPLLPARRTRRVDPGALPDAERVAAGWRAHAQPPGGLRVALPGGDPLAAARAALLVTHDDPRLPVAARAAALEALDRCGHHATVAAALPPLVLGLRAGRWDGAAQLLATAAGHHRRTRSALDDDLVGPVAQAAHKLRRRARDDAWTPIGQLAAAELLDGAGQPDAAARCRRLAAGVRSTEPALGRDDAGDAGLVRATLDRLVVDDASGVALAPGYADEWLGQGVEVHDAPTRFGPVSFAVRWHGPRPALLWQCEGPVRLRAPRLDHAWSTEEPRGEALLPPVGLPGVVAPLAGARTPVAAADDGGTLT